MPIRKHSAVVALALVFITQAAHGWSEAGHKIIVALAVRQLSPVQRQQLVELLANHPRFAEDFMAYMPPDVASGDELCRQEWLLAQAAIWPDMARGLPDELKALYNHPTWHYIDIPSFLTEADRVALEPTLKINNSLEIPAAPENDMNAVQTIRVARRELRAGSGDSASRAVWLCWLLHDIGDLHQPLHSTAMFATRLFPDGDKGGNSISTQQGFNLHALWDELLGDWATFAMVRSRADDLLRRSDLAQLGQKSARDIDEKTWLDESRQLAESAVYTPEVLAYLRVHASRAEGPPPDRLPPLRLSEAYLADSTNVATARVVQAGFRLGTVLQSLAGE